MSDIVSCNENELLPLDMSAKLVEPCSDVVSRQAVLDTLDNMDNVLDEDRTIENYKELLKECYEVLPPVNPQPKTGHWILTIEDWNRWTCSECGYSKRTDIHVSLGYDFCPICGAKMESEDKE